METKKVKQILDEKPFDVFCLVVGWVKSFRDLGQVKFITINDGSCIRSLQVVVEDEMITADFKQVAVGSSLAVKGIVRQSTGKQQDVEVLGKEILILGLSPEDYPLQKKSHTMEFLRTKSHLRARTNIFGSMFRIRSELAFAIHDFFHSQRFVYVHTPIITGNDSEGAGEMFEVSISNGDFFNKKAFLTVSGQLHAETLALGLGNVYTFGPTFRAENSNTKRHAAEFWMVEPEMAFCDLDGMIRLSEVFIKHVVTHVFTECAEDFDFCSKLIDKECISRIENILTQPFSRISYTDAVNLLNGTKKKFEFPVKWGIDLQSEHEKFLSESIFKGPVYVTDYPKDIKAFYMRLNDDGTTVAATDLLVPAVGELFGGSQREERYTLLQQRMMDFKMNLEHYQWYLELRKYGAAPSAGFGLGFERLLMLLTGMANIRDSIPYPRTANSLDY